MYARGEMWDTWQSSSFNYGTERARAERAKKRALDETHLIANKYKHFSGLNQKLLEHWRQDDPSKLNVSFLRKMHTHAET